MTINFRVDSVYLFGSYARASHNKWSDIDIAVISPDFSDGRFGEAATNALLRRAGPAATRNRNGWNWVRPSVLCFILIPRRQKVPGYMNL